MTRLAEKYHSFAEKTGDPKKEFHQKKNIKFNKVLCTSVSDRIP